MNDPNYVFNLRLPGKVVVSRDVQKATPVKDWLREHGIETARIPALEVRSVDKSRDLRIPTGGPDPIVLDSPTLREYYNAHEALYGLNTWVATVKTIPPSELKPNGGVSIGVCGMPTYIIGGAGPK